MKPEKKKSSDPRGPDRKGPALGQVIALAMVAGIVIGSAGTYFLTKPTPTPSPSTSGGTPTPSINFAPPATAAPQQNQYTPAPQPPGEVPPGKVWSVEHGHWHDAPGSVVPGAAPVVPGTAPASPPSAAAPVAPTISTPSVTPEEKK
jgi:hypothetical protein